MPDFVSQNAPQSSSEAGANPYQTGSINMENSPAGSFGERAEAAFNVGPAPSLLAYDTLLGNRVGNALRKPLTGQDPVPKLSPEDIQGKYGVKVDAPMEDYEAKYIADAQHNQRQYQMVTQNASGIGKFTSDSVAFLADPINLGSMFIPIAGQARVATALGMGAETLAERSAVRAVTFGVQGVASQAPLSALKYGLSQTQHVDYSIADAMRDTLFGGAVGAIAGPLFGGLKDAMLGTPKWADVVDRFNRMKYSESAPIAQVAQAQMAKENPMNVEPMLDTIKPRPDSVKSIIHSGSTPLYHDTSAAGLDGILDTGKILPMPGDHANPTISVSRDFGNYSRFADSPYRLVLSDRDVPHKSEPVSMLGNGDRQEAEQVFHKPIDISAVKSLSINISNPNLLDDLKSGKFAELLQKAKDKGLPVDFYNDRSKAFLDPEAHAQAQEALGKTARQYIQDQHENGVMGLGKQELAKTIADSHVEPMTADPHSEAQRYQVQADELESSLRDKADAKAMQEHDAWKQRISTLDGAFAELKKCLMS